MNEIPWDKVVTWILVVGGWYCVHLAALRRERRKEKRDETSKTIAALYELEKAAIGFHTSALFNTYDCDVLRDKTARTIRKLQRFPIKELSVPNSSIIALRKAITLNNMDKSEFQQQEVQSSEIVKNTKVAIDGIVDHIETQREIVWP